MLPAPLAHTPTATLPRPSVTAGVGLGAAALIGVAWLAVHVSAIFLWEWRWATLPAAAALILVQAWLSTGLFIVAHDAMHGSLAPGRPRLNDAVGRAALMIYAGLDYDRLRPAHFAHHKAPGTDGDPDFHPDRPRAFGPWLLRFFFGYYTHAQLARITVVAWLKRESASLWQAVAGVWNESQGERQYCLFLNAASRTDARTMTREKCRDLAHGHVSDVGGKTDGAEACITPMGVGGFAAMRALSTRNEEPEKASRPWDKDRDGFVVGEGAGILILEELEFARRRGAPILAEIVGYGMSGDAYHITAPSEDGDGAYRVMRNAMRDAGIGPEQIDYVNAHGTSTPVGDVIECLALKRTFGEHAAKIAVSSTKSMTGHLLGGAGGLEAALTVFAIRDQIAPPTINLDNPDEQCDLDFVPHKARPMKIEYALSNSFGFGGTNGSLIFKRYSE